MNRRDFIKAAFAQYGIQAQANVNTTLPKSIIVITAEQMDAFLKDTGGHFIDRGT